MAPWGALAGGRECFADLPVQMGSAGTADLLEEGLAHQRVPERERAGSVGHFPQQAGPRCLVERKDCNGWLHAGCHGNGGEIELAADNCGDRKKAVGCLGQPRKTSPDHITNALGKTEVGGS